MNVRRMQFIPALALLFTATLTAQTPRVTELHEGLGGSPHVKAEWVISGANVSISYGRPYVKGRIIGKTLEPMPGYVWRLGADEATTLTSDRALRIGATAVPAGSYSLWVVDKGEAWELILNSQTGQFGTDYDPDRNVARIPMKLATAGKPAEQLTLSIRDGQFVIEWGTRTATVPFIVG